MTRALGMTRVLGITRALRMTRALGMTDCKVLRYSCIGHYRSTGILSSRVMLLGVTLHL